jgi:hypothetical protein
VSLDNGDLLVDIAINHELADIAGNIPVLIEIIGAASTVIIDVLAFGDQRLGLGPFARTDLSRPGADAIARSASAIFAAVGGTRLLD